MGRERERERVLGQNEMRERVCLLRVEGINGAMQQLKARAIVSFCFSTVQARGNIS